ncbi:rRNA maturation RNase YbeY [Lactobacillus sp. PV034]|uniref:rRNA maturation RNase YbeY n=1 Tax=Lactobacillus sp. PV034 TaxID=2594495 RepID=UPI0022406D89|nr:rRNA maturation RNase YbeY [Lactobacillus sp. PV034]QNQ80383.1 rRNA maturation RNase YbeY [Lactobacillus sp. PV034]
MDQLDISFNDEINFLEDSNRDWVKWITDLLLSAKEAIHKENAQEISINFVSPEEIHKINKDYRGKDRPTDVISFAIEDDEDNLMAQFFDDPDFVEDIGDLFICIDVVKKQAVDYETGFEREFGYTLVHGYLHLNGFDHIEDDEAEEMFSIQGKILREYGLPLRANQETHGKQIH